MRSARTLSWWDTLRVQLSCSIPAFLLGIVTPNRAVLWLATLGSARDPALSLLARLRDKYACDNLWTWFPLRRTLLVTDPRLVDAVLASPANAPDPVLKKRAISRFAPGALVISSNDEARDRRPFNTSALDSDRLHLHANAFALIAVREAQALVDARHATLRWSDFQRLGQRISHQVILGEGCVRPELASELSKLVNWSNALLRARASYASFHASLGRWLSGAEPIASGECLMHAARRALAEGGASDAMRAESQVAFWFFVLKDAIELHVARTLALVAAHPDVQAQVRADVRRADLTDARALDRLEFLEGCIAEEMRLWTAVPLLLRRAEQRFDLDGIVVEAGQQILVHAGLHHRDPRVFGALADAFRPDAAGAASPARYAFSAHQRSCAGRSLVMLVLKATLASLLAHHRFELVRPALLPGRIPHRYDHFAIALRTVRDDAT